MTTGVFTTIKVQQGVPLFFEKHLDRLRDHATAFAIPIPDDIPATLFTYRNNFQLHNAAVRISLMPEGNLALDHRPLPKDSGAIKVITVEDLRDELKIYKTTNRSRNEQSQQEAQQQGADDAIFTNNGFLIESTISNIFSINCKGEIITPPLKERGLEGIIRQVIMEQIQVIEEDIPADTTAPLILTNSLRLRNVTHLNGNPMTDGGKLLQQLQAMIRTAERNSRQ